MERCPKCEMTEHVKLKKKGSWRNTYVYINCNNFEFKKKRVYAKVLVGATTVGTIGFKLLTGGDTNDSV